MHSFLHMFISLIGLERSTGCGGIVCDGLNRGSGATATNGCSQGASTSSASATSSHTAGCEAASHGGTIQADDFYIAREIRAPAGQNNQLAMDATGALSLKNNGGYFLQ